MDPISNQQFSYDAEKYVYQKDIVLPRDHPVELPSKPFKIESPDKTKKSKKDLEKEKQKKKPKPYDLWVFSCWKGDLILH